MPAAQPEEQHQQEQLRQIQNELQETVSTFIDVVNENVDKVFSPKRTQDVATAVFFGAPPEDLAQHKGPIPDFFRAAEFEPVLSEKFLRKYAGKEPAWGPIGYVTYKRTYARPLYRADLNMAFDETNKDEVVRSEEFWETLTRVVNGMWHIIRCHSARKNIDFSEETAQRKAEAAFKNMWNFKWLPPGRGLWMMGTRFMYLKGSAALQNCGFVSTKNINKESSDPFTWAMDMSMLGVGIGFDTRGAGKVTIQTPSNLTDFSKLETQERIYRSTIPLPEEYQNTKQKLLNGYEVPDVRLLESKLKWALPNSSDHSTYSMVTDTDYLQDNLYIKKCFSALPAERPPYAWRKDAKNSVVISILEDTEVFLIPDSREGWVESVGMVIDAFLRGSSLPVFDYSAIRPRTTPIKNFGGVAEGPDPLILCHENLVAFLLDRVGKLLTSTDIVDIFNEIGACVVSGNVRRSAQIALGNYDDEEFFTLKHDTINHPNAWNSNNSIFAEVGMDYTKIAERIYDNGEPGVLWMDNIRKYSRMSTLDNKDTDAVGVNPCSEQSLHNYELCCLVENFPHNHDDTPDLTKTLKQSYLYAKTVTLVPCHSKKTNRVMGKNSRIGSSMSGVQNARAKFGTRKLYEMMDHGYNFITGIDKEYSEWFQVRQSIKKTSNKPSGTISKLVGCDEGVHYPTAIRYLKNMVFSKDNYQVEAYRAAGYKVRPLPEQPDSACLVSFPVQKPHVYKTERQAAQSIFEQLEFIAGVQNYWADNQVSVTIKFLQHTDACLASMNTLKLIYTDEVVECQYNCREQVISDIKTALELYETRLKSVAFLPFFEADQTAYAWMPEEPISQKNFDKYTASLKPVHFTEYVEDLDPEECSVGGCPIR